MNNTSYSKQQTAQLNPYLVREILEASPQKLLIRIYDFAITQCKLQDMQKTNRALDELINSLNFEDAKAREISTGLLKLYQYCQDQMRKQNHGVVQTILTDLRDAWLTIFNLKR